MKKKNNIKIIVIIALIIIILVLAFIYFFYGYWYMNNCKIEKDCGMCAYIDKRPNICSKMDKFYPNVYK